MQTLYSFTELRPSRLIREKKTFLFVAVNPPEAKCPVPFEIEVFGDPSLVASAIAQAMATDRGFRILMQQAINTFSTIKPNKNETTY